MVATAISVALQHGVPSKLLVDKFAHTRFEPSGYSEHPDIGYAKSIMDYIFRWLDLKFPDGRFAEPKKSTVEVVELDDSEPESTGLAATFVAESDAPACHECGSIMVRSGACHKCLNCGATSGCS